MWAVIVACFVAGIRLILIALWGGSAPYLDECNQTGWTHIFASRSSAGIPLGWLWEPHMEHRIATQRLFSLALAAINGGEWDVGFELRVAALLWGVFAGALAAVGARCLEPRFVPFWAALVAACESIPHAWENLLWAFQVQFVFVLGFSLLTLWLLMSSRSFSGRWWWGIAAGIIACLSQAGGAAAWVAAAAAAAARAWKNRRFAAREQAAVAFLIGGTIIFLWLVPAVPSHDALRPADVSTWISALGSVFGWPWSKWPPAAMVLWFPGVIWLIRWTFLSKEERPQDACFVALLIWALTLAVATVRSRGVLLATDVPPSRYGDVLIIGVVANGWTILRWCGRERERNRICLVFGGLWAAFVLTGLIVYTADLTVRATRASNISAVPLRDFVGSRRVHEDAFRQYVATRDSRVLDVVPPIYPLPEHLADVVDRLDHARRWPAILDRGRKSEIPFFSRLARWGWLLGSGLLAASVVTTVNLLRRPNRTSSPTAES